VNKKIVLDNKQNSHGSSLFYVNGRLGIIFIVIFAFQKLKIINKMIFLKFKF